MSGANDGGAAGASDVVQTPATAAAQAAAPSYLETARAWHAQGVDLEKCAEWLVAQGDPAYKDADAAKAAISQ